MQENSTQSDLDPYEIEALKMIAGEKTFVWGAFVSVCGERLQKLGYLTPMPWRITEKGRAVLAAVPDEFKR